MFFCSILQESNETWRRMRLQQIFFKSVVSNDLDMAVRSLQHGADVADEFPPVRSLFSSFV